MNCTAAMSYHNTHLSSYRNLLDLRVRAVVATGRERVRMRRAYASWGPSEVQFSSRIRQDLRDVL